MHELACPAPLAAPHPAIIRLRLCLLWLRAVWRCRQGNHPVARLIVARKWDTLDRLIDLPGDFCYDGGNGIEAPGGAGNTPGAWHHYTGGRDAG